MTIRKSVPVTVELAGGVMTIEDVKGQLEILPDEWELASVGTPKVEVVIKVPRAVTNAAVEENVHHRMAALDYAREEAEDARNRREDEAKAIKRIGKDL